MTDPRQNVVAARLRMLRSQRPEISQDRLATALGVSQNAVGRWERGLSTPRANQIAGICDLYGISADFLIGRSDFPLGLAPDQWIVDEDAVEFARANPRKTVNVVFKVPRRMRLIEHNEVERLKRELGIVK